MSDLEQAKSAIAKDFMTTCRRIRFEVEVTRQAWQPPSAYPLGTNN